MPIEMPPMPPAVASALQSGLQRFAAVASPAAPATGRASLARGNRTMSRSIEAALAQGATAGVGAPVVVMGLEELVQGKSPRASTTAAWVQLLPAGEGGQQAMAEVDQRSGKLSSVAEGGEVKALAKGIDGLSAKRHRSAARQELQILRVPALHLTALWLKGDAASGADDIVIPSDGPIAPLVSGQRYALADFLQQLKAMATERLARSASDSGG